MQPDIIAVLQGGIVNGASAGYDARDAFGTLGGRARVEAAALLAKKFPDAIVLATDATNARELEELGVAHSRVVLNEPAQSNTLAGLKIVAAHAKGTTYIVSNEYHEARITAMWETLHVPPMHFVSAESVLVEADPTFAARFEQIKQTPAYQERLASETRGLEALKSGTYQTASAENKQERPTS